MCVCVCVCVCVCMRAKAPPKPFSKQASESLMHNLTIEAGVFSGKAETKHQTGKTGVHCKYELCLIDCLKVR